MNDFITDRCQCRIIHKERVKKAHKICPSYEEIEKIANFFKALGDATRLKIVLALAGGEMCVCDLAAFLGISESAVSHQLRLLRQLSLVTNRRQGPILYYRLVDDHISKVTAQTRAHLCE